MKTLYIECNMGAAGDMLCAALLGVHPNPKNFVERFNALWKNGIRLENKKLQKCGILGNHVDVFINGEKEHTEDCHHEHHEAHEHHEHHTHHDAHEHHEHHEHHHSHHGIKDIEEIVRALDLDSDIIKDILNVYKLIAQAESTVHGRPVKEIHFHEVGALDAVADITAVCMLMHEIAAESVYASPVNTGSGFVKCAHGILSVPAPATAELLKEIPSYSSGIQGELCTPTGAALLKYFVREFRPMPIMQTEKIGYGLGNKDFETANCLRVFLGESAEGSSDEIFELHCNIDDMTGEAIAFAAQRIFHAGATDVFTVPVAMKKNRPGTLLACLCHAETKEAVVRAIFKHTSTIGIREERKQRHVLKRTEYTMQSAFGEVRVKKSEGYGIAREKIEFEDAAKIATEHDIPICEVYSIKLKGNNASNT